MDEHPVNNIINYFAVHQRGGILAFLIINGVMKGYINL